MPRTYEKGTCAVCGTGVEWFKGNAIRRTCSRRCLGLLRVKLSTGRKMPAWFGEWRRLEFQTKNPMRKKSIRAKVSATLKRIKHRPPVRGGNGHGPTKAEQVLATALGWRTGVVVKTNKGGWRARSGYPTSYKLDVADESSMTCIEVDGASHGATIRKAQDAKKTALLNGLGWKVFRVSNREVLEELPSTISKLRALIPILRTAS